MKIKSRHALMKKRSACGVIELSPAGGWCEQMWLRWGGVPWERGYRHDECWILTLSQEEEEEKAIKDRLSQLGGKEGDARAEARHASYAARLHLRLHISAQISWCNNKSSRSLPMAWQQSSPPQAGAVPRRWRRANGALSKVCVVLGTHNTRLIKGAWETFRKNKSPCAEW